LLNLLCWMLSYSLLGHYIAASVFGYC
jgi:hypothetical protein